MGIAPVTTDSVLKIEFSLCYQNTKTGCKPKLCQNQSRDLQNGSYAKKALMLETELTREGPQAESGN